MTRSEPESWEGLSHSIEETMAVGRAVGGVARAGDLIALNGELGAGKTQFVRGLAEGVGSRTASVASPTFVMVHEYPPGRDGLVLVHIDAYRLKTTEDFESIGWVGTGAEMRRGSVVAVEWADRLGEGLGTDFLEVTLAHAGEGERRIVVQARGSWPLRWGELCAALDQALHQGPGQISEAPQGRPCPICGRPVNPSAKSFPFCTERCRTIDLGRWASGSYRISRDLEQSDVEEES